MPECRCPARIPTVCLIALALLAAPPDARAGATPQAKEILAAAGVKGGLIVHLGCGDGRVTAALWEAASHEPPTPAVAGLRRPREGGPRAASNRAGKLDARSSTLAPGCVVQGLDADRAKVEEARQHIQSLGLYGQVSVDTLDGGRLPYIDNLVNLIVVDDASGISQAEILRVLAPRGIACVRKGGEWTASAKPWPANMDEWTHWLHGPDGNAVSRDRRVGISRSLQWVMGPLWSRHHNLLPSVSAMVSAKGRLFTIIDEGPISTRGVPDRWSLNARDAFNGLLLWKRPVANWGWRTWSEVEFAGHMRFKGPLQLERRLVAVGGVVYVTLGFDAPVVALDAATGETLREYEGTSNTSEILCHKGRLILARNAASDKPGKDILAIDADTGAILWERKGYRGVTAHNDELSRFTDAFLTAGDDRVFFLDADHIVALDLASGAEAWRTPRPPVKKGVIGHYKYNHANLCSLTWADGRLFLGQMLPFPDNLNKRQQKEMVILAMDAASGKTLWQGRGMTLAHFTPPDLFVAHGMVWTFKMKEVSLLGLDVRTGEVRKEYPARSILVGHHARCYRNKATERFYLAGEEGIEYIDLASGEVDIHHWVRGACRYGILPANGLIYLPTHSCGCHHNVKLNGFLALAPAGEWQGSSDKVRVEETPRFEKGPAYGASATRTSNLDTSSDWPVYKHDNRRSNCAATEVPTELAARWRSSVGGRLTAPVIAGGRVFLASRTSHQVCCLDTDTGETAWRFTADGPVDTPPTWHKGRVFFGSRGGSVYALAADDGRLAWRFQAAPAKVRLMAFGDLESPWPVHGSLLVLNDKVYCVAGRSMHLNGGLYACALDAKTGRLLQQTRLVADVEPKGELGDAVLPDILVSDGRQITMRSMRFSPEDISHHSVAKGGSFLLANDGGLLDGTWFNSTFWRYGGAAAQMLVFDGEEVYGVRAYRKNVTKSYPHDIFTAGKGGYRLFARAVGGAKPGASRRRGKAARPSDRWTLSIPVRAEAMVLTGQRLFVAGSPDVVDEQDPWAALERRGGGMLVVLSRADGRKLAEHRLASAPVYDGMAAARGRLYLSTADGRVVCFGGQQ